MRNFVRLGGAAVGFWLAISPGTAGPWAPVGDAQLRSDIQVLAGAGALDNITMQWPLPWAGVLDRLDQDGALSGQPDFVREAAERVRTIGKSETRTGELRSSVAFDAASEPNLIRGYDALGRQEVQGQASAEYLWKSTAVHVELGARSSSGTDRQAFVADNSYIAQRIGDAMIYGGYVTHWWGPGWISAMSLSNNARPVPQIGITRVTSAPFSSPWLSWIGPWQVDFFVGVLDGPRIARRTVYDGLRIALSPIPHLEIGFSRTDMMCGTGHPCKPLVGYFDLMNRDDHLNIVNDQGSIDVKYSGALAGWVYEVYAQAMNEDTNPFVHSGTSHLFGGSLWTPVAGGIGRLTVEYTDSHATRDLWGSGIFYGFSYNNGRYPDGMRYRGRALGFSLDNDSRLFSVQASYTDRGARSYTLTYHHAEISDPRSAGANPITPLPVTVNQVQARVSLPFALSERRLRLDLEGRLQDDQPRPDEGFMASIEAVLRLDL